MGIRIAHEPVAAPLMASFATGLAKGQERAADKQLMLLRQREAERQRFQLQANAQIFAAAQNQQDRDFTTQRDTARFEQERSMFDMQNAAYRDKDELGELYNGIQQREQFMNNAPLTEEGQRQRNEAAQSLAWIRQQRDSVRPEVYRQYMAQWMREFDTRNPQSWQAQPPNPVDQLGQRATYWGSNGLMSQEEAQKNPGQVTMIGVDDGRGGVRWTPVPEKQQQQFPATDHEFFSDQKNYDWARKEAIAALTETDNLTGVSKPPTDQDAIEKKMRELYEQRKRMATPPQQPQGDGGAPMSQPNAGLQELGRMPAAAPPAAPQQAPPQAPAQPAPAVVTPPAQQAPLNNADPYVQGMYQNMQQWQQPGAQPAQREPAMPSDLGPREPKKGFSPQQDVQGGRNLQPGISPELLETWLARSPAMSQYGDQLRAISKKPASDWTPGERQLMWNAYRQAQMAGMPGMMP